MPHKNDSTGRCIYCGLDTSDWFQWKYDTYAGNKSKATYPECKREAGREEYEQIDNFQRERG